MRPSMTAGLTAPGTAGPDSRRLAHVVAQSVDSPRSGYAMRTWMVSTALSSCGELHVVDIGPNRMARDDEGDLLLGEGRVATYHSVDAAEAGAWLDGNGFDVVVAAETALAPWVRDVTGAVRVANCQNVESELWRQRAARTAGAERAANLQRARTSELLERAVFPQLEQVWVATRTDADTLVAHAPDISAHVVPNVVVVGGDTVRRPEQGHGVFFGSLWWEPNQAAVTELLQVSDELHLRGQGHRITVAGAGAPTELVAAMATRAAVVYDGFVPDLAELLERAAVVVLPVTYGGGSMVKLIDALAHGCPVVTTPEGARGFPDVVDGVHAVVRPLGERFNDAVAAMLVSPERYAHLGSAGRALVRESYSLAVLDTVVSGLVG